MRIAYICADQGVPVFGCKGCSIHVQEVLAVLTRMGAQVDLFTPRPEGDRPSGRESLQIHELRAVRGDCAAREQALLASNEDLRALLEREGPFDLVYERYSLWSFAGMEYAVTAQTPGILEVNAPLIEEQIQHRELIHRREAERVAERVFRAATVLVAVSNEIGQYLRHCPGTHDRVHVVPNGVNPHRFRLRNAPARKDNESFTVGFVGSLKRWHGLPVLVEAFALLHNSDPTARLLIVGDGPERVSLEDELRSLGLRADAQLTGAVHPSEVPGLLAQMDVAVAPYPKLPGFYFSPLKVLEYMATGLAVAASNIGQIEQLIQHEQTGLLFPPGNPVALGEALARLRRDPEMRAQLGKNARSSVLREHTWEMVVTRILETAGCLSLLQTNVHKVGVS